MEDKSNISDGWTYYLGEMFWLHNLKIPNTIVPRAGADQNYTLNSQTFPPGLSGWISSF